MKLPTTDLSGSTPRPGATQGSRSTTRHASAFAVLVLSAVLALSACGSSDPADAATVNGDVISTHDVQAVAHEINIARQAQQPVVPSDILAILIEGKFALQARAAAGKAVSADEARTVVAEQLHWKDPSPEAVDFFQHVIAVEAARQDPAETKTVSTALANATISVNPRYGTDFNLKTRQMANEAPDWIQPVEVPAAPTPDEAPGPVPAPPPPPRN